jgi:hypothetical protein
VPPKEGVDLNPTIQTIPLEVEDLLERAFPDFLGFEANRRSARAYTITLLTLDFRYRYVLASQAVDGHWTISPLDGILG